jgi:hypothetical protein
MQSFDEIAGQTVARDAALAAVLGVMLMFALSFAPAVALDGAAMVALLFSIALVYRARQLTDDSVSRLEAWVRLQPEQRPIGPSGRRLARDRFEQLLLHAAKSSAAVAVGLFVIALLAGIAS